MGKKKKSTVQLSELKLKNDGLRTYAEKDLDTAKRNISKAPFMLRVRPILVEEDGEIIIGDMEYRALEALEYEEIPSDWVRVVDDMTEEQIEQMRIKGELHYGDWDWMKLEEQYDIDFLEEVGIDVFEGEADIDYGDIFDGDGGEIAARMEKMEAEVKKALQVNVQEEQYQYLLKKLGEIRDEGGNPGRLFIAACERKLFEFEEEE